MNTSAVILEKVLQKNIMEELYVVGDFMWTTSQKIR